MPLPTFATQDEIPEAFRAEYVEHEGAWKPKAELDLRTEAEKRQTLLDEKKQEQKLRREAEAQRDELKRAAEAKAAGVPDEEMQRLRDEDAAKRKPIEDENAALKAELRTLKLTDRVKSLALKAGVAPDAIDDAMLVLDRRTELTDGNSIQVKDKDGKVTTETIEDFLAKTFKAEKPWFYAFQGTGGGGADRSAARVEPQTQQAATDAHRQRVAAAI